MRLQTRAERRRIKAPVDFWLPGYDSEYRPGRALNISSTGVFVATPEPVAPPTIVSLRFALGETQVDVRGEVIRTVGGASHQRQEGAGMGLRILAPESDAVRQLRDHFSA